MAAQTIVHIAFATAFCHNVNNRFEATESNSDAPLVLIHPHNVNFHFLRQVCIVPKSRTVAARHLIRYDVKWLIENENNHELIP